MFFRAESLFQIDLETVGQVRQVAEHIGEFCSVISAVSLALRAARALSVRITAACWEQRKLPF